MTFEDIGRLFVIARSISNQKFWGDYYEAIATTTWHFANASWVATQLVLISLTRDSLIAECKLPSIKTTTTMQKMEMNALFMATKLSWSMYEALKTQPSSLSRTPSTYYRTSYSQTHKSLWADSVHHRKKPFWGTPTNSEECHKLYRRCSKTKFQYASLMPTQKKIQPTLVCRSTLITTARSFLVVRFNSFTHSNQRMDHSLLCAWTKRTTEDTYRNIAECCHINIRRQLLDLQRLAHSE